MISRPVRVLALSALALALAACERQKIGDINADPGRFQNKEVSIAGEVTQSMGALGQGIYQIDDGTGKLWVLARNRAVPAKGAYVGAKGRVQPTVTFLGVNYATVLFESGRRSVDRTSD